MDRSGDTSQHVFCKNSAKGQFRFWNIDSASPGGKRRKWEGKGSNFQPRGYAQASAAANLRSRQRNGRSTERTKNKENAKHFSPLISRINMEGDTCRRWQEQPACLPVTFCHPSFLHRAARLCLLLPDRSRKCACGLRGLKAAVSLLAQAPGPRSLSASSLQLSDHRPRPPAASGAHTHAGCSGAGTMANTFSRLLHLTKPPLRWKHVSSTDNMLSDNSFSFCIRELLNISFLSPPHSGELSQDSKGSPRELLERLMPRRSLEPPLVDVSMLPPAGRQRPSSARELSFALLSRGFFAGRCRGPVSLYPKQHNLNSPTLRASGPHCECSVQLLCPRRGRFSILVRPSVHRMKRSHGPVLPERLAGGTKICAKGRGFLQGKRETTLGSREATPGAQGSATLCSPARTPVGCSLLGLLSSQAVFVAPAPQSQPPFPPLPPPTSLVPTPAALPCPSPAGTSTPNQSANIQSLIGCLAEG